MYPDSDAYLSTVTLKLLFIIFYGNLHPSPFSLSANFDHSTSSMSAWRSLLLPLQVVSSKLISGASFTDTETVTINRYTIEGQPDVLLLSATKEETTTQYIVVLSLR